MNPVQIVPNVELAERSALVRAFEWRDQRGVFHPIGEMETRHLWFTLRMIWNHSCPPDAQLLPFRRYRFGPFYTPGYVMTAVRNIASELGNREDMQVQWKRELNSMITYLNQHEGAKILLA